MGICKGGKGEWRREKVEKGGLCKDIITLSKFIGLCVWFFLGGGKPGYKKDSLAPQSNRRWMISEAIAQQHAR